jgi:hypothetical protein
MDIDAMFTESGREQLARTTRIGQRVRMPNERDINAPRICTSAESLRLVPGIRAATDRRRDGKERRNEASPLQG